MSLLDLTGPRAYFQMIRDSEVQGMRMAVLSFVLPGLLAGASVATAQGPEIGHNRVECLVAGQFPKMAACFRPPGSAARGRVYFRPEAVPDWYYVEMESDAPCYAGVLPRPTAKLINTRVLYYVHVVDKSFAESQTAEYNPVVVEKESDCKDRALLAPFSRSGPRAVFPSVPRGFAMGSRVSPVVIGVGGAAIVGGGVAIGISGQDKAPPTAPPTPSPPTPTPSPAPTPTPTPTPPGESPLTVACQAQPRSGYAPLTVAFETFPSGGTGSYEFRWDFGDGGTANRSNPNHTYTVTGTFTAVVKVTSGSQEASCSRTITVTSPPPPEVTFPLSVAKAGSGTGTVTSSPAGIGCGGTCTASFTQGTVVTLSQSASLGSVFAGWSGACTGTGACSVTMDAAKSVTATFNLGAPPPSAVLAPASAAAREGSASSGPHIVHLTTDLQVAGGRGHVAVNGQTTLAAGPGVTRATLALRGGENYVEAWLAEAQAAGQWRFDLGDVVEPGSLAVLAGDVQLATSDAVVFRIRGFAGERILFTFRRRGRAP
jgi:PKD repeat protein